jgi:hypothetical protein
VCKDKVCNTHGGEDDCAPGISSRRWKYKVNVDLRKEDGCVTDSIDLAEDREYWTALVNTITKLRAL